MFSCRTGTRTWRAEGLDSVGCPCNHAARAPLLSVSLLDQARRISHFCSCDVSTGGRAVRVPRTPGVVKKNELPTSAGKWFRQQCDAEDEVGDAFRDLLVCGMGWTETRLDFGDNPEGDPLEMVWDRGAKSKTWSTRGAWRISAGTCRLIRPRALSEDAQGLPASLRWKRAARDRRTTSGCRLFADRCELGRGRRRCQPSDCMSEPQTSVKRVRWAQAWRGVRPEQPVTAKVDP